MFANNLNIFFKSQKGSVFITALIILVFGSLVLSPLLSYIGSGLIVGEVFEEETAEYYDADAGIEDAIWQLMNEKTGIVNNGIVRASGSDYVVKGILNGLYWLDLDSDGEVDEDEGFSPRDYPVVYTLSDSPNGNSVEVFLQDVGDGSTYLVISESPSDGNVDSDVQDPIWTGTRIEAFVNDVTVDLTDIMENVITGKGTGSITILPEGSEYVQPLPPDEHAPEEYTAGWPDAEDVIAAFEKVIKDGATEYLPDTLILTADQSIDYQFFHDGPLTISSDNMGPHELTLNGDIYITGQTVLGGSHDWTLNLNGHTIFVESPLEKGPGSPDVALSIEQEVTFKGSGAIIAIGDIYFSPTMQSSADDYIFIMSISGETEMQPNGNFYGTLAGEAVVTRKGNAYITWSDYSDKDLNIPGLITHLFFGTASYEIDEGRRF